VKIMQKQKIIFKILPKGSKDKVEGIIIGLNIRENLEHGNTN